MPILGAGVQPAGSSGAGGAYAPVTPPSPYVVYPDPLSGLSDSGRLIDPLTGRFVYTATGDPVGQKTIPQIVQIAWTTLDFSSVGPLDDGVANRAYAAYQAAVAPLVSAGQMAILSFTAQRVKGTSGLNVRVRWRDLTAGVEHTYETGAPQT